MDQAVHSLNIYPRDPLHSLLPGRNDLGSPTVIVSDVCDSCTSTLNVVRLHQEELHQIDSFGNNGIVVPLPPLCKKVFEASEIRYLTMIYNIFSFRTLCKH